MPASYELWHKILFQMSDNFFLQSVSIFFTTKRLFKLKNKQQSDRPRSGMLAVKEWRKEDHGLAETVFVVQKSFCITSKALSQNYHCHCQQDSSLICYSSAKFFQQLIIRGYVDGQVPIVINSTRRTPFLLQKQWLYKVNYVSINFLFFYVNVSLTPVILVCRQI